jgi:hypothetical protein
MSVSSKRAVDRRSRIVVTTRFLCIFFVFMVFLWNRLPEKKSVRGKGKSATPIMLTGTMHAVAGRIR